MLWIIVYEKPFGRELVTHKTFASLLQHRHTNVLKAILDKPVDELGHVNRPFIDDFAQSLAVKRLAHLVQLPRAENSNLPVCFRSKYLGTLLGLHVFDDLRQVQLHAFVGVLGVHDLANLLEHLLLV